MKKTWIWRWSDGGYNTACAETRAEALEAARKMATRTILTVNERTLHVAAPGEVEAAEREFSRAFD